VPLLPASLLDRLAALTLRAKRRGAGITAGARPSTRRGRSQEFADHRPYVPGDDLRFLDWHLYGRLDTLWIKLFEEEEDRVVQCLVDSSGSMEGEKLDYARQLAAALAFLALGVGDRVTVSGLGRQVTAHAPARRGRGQAASLFRTLEAIHPGGGTDLGAAVAKLPHQRGAGIALLFTDLLYPDGPDAALRRLLAAHQDVHVFHLLTPAEIRPALGGDLLLADAETGEELTITVDAEVLDRYEATMRAWAEEMERTCRALGVTYHRVVTDRPVEAVVLEDLRRRGLVG
jgi:uncharacterized protein (DUF58 family)